MLRIFVTLLNTAQVPRKAKATLEKQLKEVTTLQTVEKIALKLLRKDLGLKSEFKLSMQRQVATPIKLDIFWPKVPKTVQEKGEREEREEKEKKAANDDNGRWCRRC